MRSIVFGQTAELLPSKQTRDAIIIAAEAISNSVQEDFIKSHKEDFLFKEKWDLIPLVTSRRPGNLPEEKMTDPSDGMEMPLNETQT